MKKFKAIDFILFTALILCPWFGRAEAQDTVPVCFDLVSEGASLCAEFMVMPVGPYASLYGKVTSQDAVGRCSPVHGSAIMNGSVIKFTLVSSSEEPLERSNDIIHGELDGTMSGTFKTIGHVGSRTAPGSPLTIEHVADQGTVSLRGCPCQCQ
jgi:hypothetical protein